MCYHNYGMRRFWIAPMIIAALAAFGALTMVLWNALMPALFNLPVITFWQALGLLILTRLLFSGLRPFGHWHHNSPWKNELRNKLKNMTPEERKEFFTKMHKNREEWRKEFCATHDLKPE